MPKTANCVMGADEVPTLRLRLLMAPVPPPSILTHTHQIYLIGPCGAPAQSKRVKNSGGVVEKCVCVGGRVRSDVGPREPRPV